MPVQTCKSLFKVAFGIVVVLWEVTENLTLGYLLNEWSIPKNWVEYRRTMSFQFASEKFDPLIYQ
jgi:hypothetical protein